MSTRQAGRSSILHQPFVQAANQSIQPVTAKAPELAEKDIKEIASSAEAVRSATQELDRRLEQFVQLNDSLNGLMSRHPGILGWKMGHMPAKMDQMHVWANDTLDAAQKSEQKIQHIETKLADIEDRVQQTSNQLHSSLEQSLQEMTAKFVTDVAQKLQEQREQHDMDNRQLNERLEELSGHSSQSAADAQDVLGRLEQLAMKLDAKVDNVAETGNFLKSAASNMAQQVQENREQESGFYSDIQLKLERQTSQQGESLQGVQSSLDRLHEPVVGDIHKTRRLMTSDFKLVLEEIARIQKALNVDYVFISKRNCDKDQTKSLNGKAMAEKDEERAASKDMAEGLETAKQLEDEDDMISAGCIRVREIFSQTEAPDVKDGFMQTDPVQFEDKKKKKPPGPEKPEEVVKKKPTAFSGADRLKKQAKAKSMKRPYDVTDYYHQRGIIQYIARHPVFDNLTLLIVMINAIWIAIDTDLNGADMLLNADPVFIIAENAFCTYFFLELLIRFLAFKSKLACLKDGWFVFDLLLVIQMSIDTWILPVIFMAMGGSGAGVKGLEMLKMARLVRIARMARMLRLLRALPELLIIVKGLAFAARSVLVFFAMWGMMVYLFAVFFRQVSREALVGDLHFGSVPSAMNTLILHGIFGANAGIINEISEIGGYGYWVPIVFFFTTVSVTTMYMLVGVLVDVVGTVANVEKEGLQVSHLASQLRIELEKNGYKEDAHISQQEFQNIMMLPGIMDIVQEAGVDVNVLADMLDLICEDVAKKEGAYMTFPDLVEVVLSMRGTNPATVKDCKEQIRIMKVITKSCVAELSEDLKRELTKLRQDIRDSDCVDYGIEDDE